MEKFMGIDVGGTNIKIGIVDTDGNLEHKVKYATAKARESNDFAGEFLNILEVEFEKHPEIKKVGIGLPGTLSKDRSTPLELPAIPGLNQVPLKKRLIERFPDKIFHLENDANAAALGEYYFSGEKMPEDYIFITLGTGVGGAAIINHEIFTGGDGNGMEIGHMLSKNGKLLEKNIGKRGLMARTRALMQTNKTVLNQMTQLDPKKVLDAAEKGDKVAKQIFSEMGTLLGEALVSAIRVLDIKTVLIGGGLSAAFDAIMPAMQKSLQAGLTQYYLKELNIRTATLGNNAGIVGAASLCFKSS